MSASVVTLMILFFSADGSGVLQAAWSPERPYTSLEECENFAATYLAMPVAASYVGMKRKAICVDDTGAK